MPARSVDAERTGRENKECLTLLFITPILRGTTESTECGYTGSRRGIHLGSCFKKNLWWSRGRCREPVASSCSTFRLYLRFQTEASLAQAACSPGLGSDGKWGPGHFCPAGLLSWTISELLVALCKTLRPATQAQALCPILLPSSSLSGCQISTKIWTLFLYNSHLSSFTSHRHYPTPPANKLLLTPSQLLLLKNREWTMWSVVLWSIFNLSINSLIFYPSNYYQRTRWQHE